MQHRNCDRNCNLFLRRCHMKGAYRDEEIHVHQLYWLFFYLPRNTNQQFNRKKILSAILNVVTHSRNYYYKCSCKGPIVKDFIGKFSTQKCIFTYLILHSRKETCLLANIQLLLSPIKFLGSF